MTTASGLLRLWIFNGLYGHDDWPYLFYVRSFLNGDTHEIFESPHGLRWGIWVPIATLFKVFGVHYWLVFVPGFVLGLACIPLAYWITLRLSGDVRAARCAGFALALNPIDWFVSTTVRGDIEMSFYGGLMGLGLVLLASPRESRSSRPVWLALAIGIVWGLAALTKEWAYVYAWGFLCVVLWRGCAERRIPWEYAYILVGFIGVLAADSLFLYLETGTFEQRFLVNIAVYDRIRPEGGYLDDRSLSHAYLPSLLLNLSNDYSSNQRFVNGYPAYGWYFYLFIGALAWGFSRPWGRIARWASLLCFIYGTMLWMEFGSMSVSAYLPFHKEPRYLTILSVPIASYIGWALYSFWLWLRPRIRAFLAVLLVALVLETGSIMQSEHALYRGVRDFLPGLTRWLEAHPDTRLWVTGSVQQDIDLRFGYRFADPVHKHRGQPGYGAIQDVGFFDQARIGDLVLITPVCRTVLGSRYTPEKWERVTVFDGPSSRAILFRLRP
jgi:hypothetical protein